MSIEWVHTKEMTVEGLPVGTFEDDYGTQNDTVAMAILTCDGDGVVVEGDLFELLAAIAGQLIAVEGVEPGTREMALLRARLAVAVGGYETGADAAAGLRDLLTDTMHALSSAPQDAPELLSVVDQVDVARNVFEQEDAEWTEGA